MLLDDLAAYLEAAGVATVGTDLFKGRYMDSPDAQVALLESGGLPPVTPFSSHAGLTVATYPRVQVLVRGAPDDYAGPRTVAESAWAALHNAGQNATLTSTTARYGLIQALSPPYYVETDANNRVLVAFNVQITRTT